MRLSKLFTKTSKSISADEVSINAQYLLRGGFVNRTIAGVYAFLPLGLRVLNKIENIIRKHMDGVSQEIVMAALQPMENWKTTNRLDVVDVLMKTTGANEKSKNKSTNEYILGPTHEEIVTPLVQDYVRSYKDLPTSVYQFQSKFRNEARAKSGLLRGREFRMKDAYSFHVDENDLSIYYEEMKKVYMNIFHELGIGKDTYITAASGGDFTDKFSHEFQTICDSGEDVIYIDENTGLAYNTEIINEENEQKLGVKFADMKQVKACEVGNIFPLNTKFSKSFNYTYTDSDNTNKLVYMGCYGIGPSRVMGVIVENSHDDKGILWPENVAPYKYIILPIGEKNLELANKYYDISCQKGIDVCIDDRLLNPGAMFADADLIGIPYQIVISDKTLSQGDDIVEFINRSTGEKKIVNFNDIY